MANPLTSLTNTTMTIDSLGLQKFLLSHGVLLEHQTKDSLEKFFSRDDTTQILEMKLGTEVKVNEISDPFEIDVFFDVVTLSSIMPVSAKRQGQNIFGDPIEKLETITLTDVKIRTLIAIECKGHPSEGFLLCRTGNDLAEGESIKQILHVFYEKSENSHEAIYNHCKFPICDWAHFIKRTKDNQRIKEGIPYQEDKEKFDHAVEQSFRSKLHLINELRERPVPGQPISLTRPLSLVVTNAAIVGMSVLADEVQFHTLPWVAYKNTLEFSRQHSLNPEICNFTYVVTYEHLLHFLDIFLSPNKDFDSFPPGLALPPTSFSLSSLLNYD